MPLLILFYNIFAVPLFLLSVKVAGLFNAKIRQTGRGRKNLYAILAQRLQKLAAQDRIWLHISSMGEFEQGKPVIDELCRQYPSHGIVVSVFSPSGYDHIHIDHPRVIVTYLPFDSYTSARKFINLVRPVFAMVVRHDFWPNFQYVLHRKNIPSFLIDASISDARIKSTKRFMFYFRPIYKTFTAICTISQIQSERFQRILPDQKIVHCGDTRYDRVYDRAMDTQKISALTESGIFNKDKCMVLGSTWPSGEKVILPALLQLLQDDPDFKLIIAPHETTPSHLQQIETFFAQTEFLVTRLANFKNWQNNSRVLLIDRIGLLANLYALGKIAYVGGGFGPGVHNVLEPAAHGAVVFYGPRHLNSPEAEYMSREHIGSPFSSTEEFQSQLTAFLHDPALLSAQQKLTHDFVMQNIGASKKTIAVIRECTSL